MDIIVAHEKHGTFTYALASDVIRARVEDGYWYHGDDLAKAVAILEQLDLTIKERSAWKFLDSRSDYEYEYVEWQQVR